MNNGIVKTSNIFANSDILLINMGINYNSKTHITFSLTFNTSINTLDSDFAYNGGTTSGLIVYLLNTNTSTQYQLERTSISTSNTLSTETFGYLSNNVLNCIYDYNQNSNIYLDPSATYNLVITTHNGGNVLSKSFTLSNTNNKTGNNHINVVLENNPSFESTQILNLYNGTNAIFLDYNSVYYETSDILTFYPVGRTSKLGIESTSAISINNTYSIHTSSPNPPSGITYTSRAGFLFGVSTILPNYTYFNFSGLGARVLKTNSQITDFNDTPVNFGSIKCGIDKIFSSTILNNNYSTSGIYTINIPPLLPVGGNATVTFNSNELFVSGTAGIASTSFGTLPVNVSPDINNDYVFNITYPNVPYPNSGTAWATINISVESLVLSQYVQYSITPNNSPIIGNVTGTTSGIHNNAYTYSTTAMDVDGWITKVIFLDTISGTILGADAHITATNVLGTYSINWTSVAGLYNLKAIAYDNLGATKYSTAGLSVYIS